MIRLISLLGALSVSVLSLQSHAAGTAAGTEIENQASVSYNAGAGTVTADSNVVKVKVQELVSATMQSQDAGDVAVSPTQTGAVLKFMLTNTGNGNEAFVLTANNLTGDDFDASNFTFYSDSDGSGDFDSSTDTLLTANTSPSLAADESLVIWVTSDIPSALADNDSADVQIAALSKTFSDASNSSPSPGDSVATAGDNATDAVYGSSGLVADQATLVVSAISVNIVKSRIAINDQFGGTQPVPGAEVDYRITITVTGNGDANDLIVTDPLPSELTLKDGVSGTITVSLDNGATSNDETAASDTDSATYDANTSTISVDLGTVTSGADPILIDFTTVIQ